MRRTTWIAIVTLVAVVLSVSASWATTANIGFKGGLNLADIKGDDTEDVNTRTAFIGGAFLGLDFTEILGARVEALYAMKGGKFDTLFGSATIKFNYIEIPVLVVANIPVSESFAISPFAGPVFAFKAGAKIEADNDSADITGLKSFDLGIVFGLGGEVATGSFSVIFDFRYDLGLMEINEDYDPNAPESDFDISSDDSKIKNAAFGFMVGVAFPVGN